MRPLPPQYPSLVLSGSRGTFRGSRERERRPLSLAVVTTGTAPRASATRAAQGVRAAIMPATEGDGEVGGIVNGDYARVTMLALQQGSDQADGGACSEEEHALPRYRSRRPPDRAPIGEQASSVPAVVTVDDAGTRSCPLWQARRRRERLASGDHGVTNY